MLRDKLKLIKSLETSVQETVFANRWSDSAFCLWISQIFHRQKIWRVLRAYINNSLYLARKYAQIFVRGHYLFREANSFPRAKLEENCELQGADNVQGQIFEHIFKIKWRLLCLLSFESFSQHAGISRESAGSAILSYVFWYWFIDQHLYLFFCHKSKPFPLLEIYFNCKQDAPWSFWNWGISLGEYPRIFPSFSWGIFGHVRRLDQSRASENIWWILSTIIMHAPYVCFVHCGVIQNSVWPITVLAWPWLFYNSW